MEWAQAATIIGVFAGVIGLQSLWIARSLDALRSEMHSASTASRRGSTASRDGNLLTFAGPDEPRLVGEHHGLHAVAQVELLPDVRDVGLHGVLGDDELGGISALGVLVLAADLVIYVADMT